MSTEKHTKEERGYFRITDWVGFEYRVLDETEYHRLRLASQYAEVPALDELAEIDQQIQLVIDRIKIKTPDIADLGNLLNKKIQLILEHSDIGDNLINLDQFNQTQVDISATGMAFPSSKAINIGEFLQIDLVLQSGRQHLSLLATVVGCDLDSESLGDGDPSITHVVRINFTDMSENISEFLIQYLVKRQGVLLKSRRLLTK